MSKTRPSTCRECGQPTRNGRAHCGLHSPQRAGGEHQDKYADRERETGAGGGATGPGADAA